MQEQQLFFTTAHNFNHMPARWLLWELSLREWSKKQAGWLLGLLCC